jgi:hypothetical protein
MPQRPVPPTGTILTVLVDAASHRLLLERLSAHAPNIAGLGSVRSLPVSAPRLRPPAIPPRQLIARYFAALNAHHWYSAYLLEATCVAIFALPNGSGAPVGSGGFEARPAARVSHGGSSVLRAARVTSIRPFHDSLLTRNHFLGFNVSAWLTFAYPPVSSGYAGNNERPSGHHTIKMILHRCDGRWGIDAGWLGTGGPWNWT